MAMNIVENSWKKMPVRQSAAIDRSAVMLWDSEVNMPALRGEMRINEPMSKHTSWRVGGHADRYYIPADLNDLASFLQNLSSEEPVFVIGLGSNLLVRDGGLRGTVVALHAQLNDLQLIEQDQSGGLIYAGAGLACAKVARFAHQHHLAGAEFLAGIPGTVGGALAMNAGCFGSETWQIVEQVHVIHRNGQILHRQPHEYQISYRSIKLQQPFISTEWFVGSYFRLPSGNQVESRQKIKQLLSKRVSTQPLQQPNAGSVFRNPPGDYAARLIELCGLKGDCIGNAMVSPKHANFIVNTGHAKAADIESLIQRVQDIVQQETGVTLIREVQIVGDSGRSAK